MSNIPEEQPPEDPTALREWLSRMMILINGAFDNTGVMDAIGKIPGYIIDGLFKYFPNAIDPDIKYPGPWIVIDGEWRPMVGMTNYGAYVQGKKYMAQDVVYGSGWTMSSKENNNFDYPFPVDGGPAVRVPVSDPAWAEESFEGVVRSGFDLEFTQGGHYGGLAIWVPELTSTTSYVIYVGDITDPNDTKFISIPEPLLIANEWSIITLTETLITAGRKFRIFIDALNSGSDTTWQYPWTFSGDNNNTVPTYGAWNKSTQNDVLRIHEEDGDGIVHTLELQVVVGTVFTITDLSNPDSYGSWRVTAPYTIQDNGNGLVYLYNVSLVDTGADGLPSVGAGCQVRAVQPVAQDTKYVQSAGYWTGNQPSFANVTGYLALDGVEQNVPNDAFGALISFTPGSVSNKWEYVAYSPDTASVAAMVKAIVDNTVSNTSITNSDKVVGFSDIPQVPSALDTPLQIAFGGAHGTTSDPVQILADGTIKCNKGGDYDFDFITYVGRTSNTQHANVVLFAEENGLLSDSSGVITIDHSADILPYSFSTTHHMMAGDEVRFYVYRDSSGRNDGGLYPFTTALSSVPNVPSAYIKVTQRELTI